MVVRPIRPDDHKQVRRGRYITVIDALPETVTVNGVPVIAPNGEGVLQAVNRKLFGIPFQVAECDWPFVLAIACADSELVQQGQRVMFDARQKTLAFTSAKYARRFSSNADCD